MASYMHIRVISLVLSSMILTQYLHQLGKECDISGAIVISATWEPFATRKSLEDVFINRVLYSRLMVNNLKAIIKTYVRTCTHYMVHFQFSEMWMR